MWWMGDRLVTASMTELRVWGATEPRERWRFRSDTDVRYSPCASVDSAWGRNAAFFTRRAATKREGGVTVRDLTHASERTLPVPVDFCHALTFSLDGQWLALVGSREAWFWNTSTWQSYSLPLSAGTGQYIGAQASERGILLQVTGPLGSKANDSVNEVTLSAADGPRVARQYKIPKALSGNDCDSKALEQTAGWKDAFDSSQYTSRGRRCLSVGWELRIWCRDQPLGAHDCDLELVPQDLTRAAQFWDKELWRPDASFLDAF